MKSLLIRNIWAVGRNYAAHAAEMKAETFPATVTELILRDRSVGTGEAAEDGSGC